jgi:FixJ family two-component response regulator
MSDGCRSSDPGDTVYLVDDDPGVLRAVARLLNAVGLPVVTFDSPMAFLDGHDPAAPGCAVLDIAMNGLSGLELQQALAERGSVRPIIFLTGRGDIPTTVRAMKAGAVDFLTKPVEADRLVDAIRAALEKDRLARQARGEREGIEQRLARLTPRELEVLRHVIAGRLNKQIAAALGTAEKTVKVHRGRLMTKLAVRSVAELVRIAGMADITPADDWRPSAVGRTQV